MMIVVIQVSIMGNVDVESGEELEGQCGRGVELGCYAHPLTRASMDYNLQGQ